MSEENLLSRIREDMKAAMRAKEKDRLMVIRLMIDAIRKREIDTRCELSNPEILEILNKLIKQRRDSEQQYLKADRSELAQQEANEIVVIQEYLPEPLSNDAINTFIDEAISKQGASSMKDMGKVIAILKGLLGGRADMGKVSKQVKQKLAAL
jgi:uncharacterized protein YqeY